MGVLPKKNIRVTVSKKVQEKTKLEELGCHPLLKEPIHQESNISHQNGKRKIIDSKSAFSGRGYVIEAFPGEYLFSVYVAEV